MPCPVIYSKSFECKNPFIIFHIPPASTLYLGFDKELAHSFLFLSPVVLKENERLLPLPRHTPTPKGVQSSMVQRSEVRALELKLLSFKVQLYLPCTRSWASSFNLLDP